MAELSTPERQCFRHTDRNLGLPLGHEITLKTVATRHFSQTGSSTQRGYRAALRQLKLIKAKTSHISLPLKDKFSLNQSEMEQNEAFTHWSATYILTYIHSLLSWGIKTFALHGEWLGCFFFPFLAPYSKCLLLLAEPIGGHGPCKVLSAEEVCHIATCRERREES